MARLTDLARNAIITHHLQGWNQAKIARQLGISRKTVQKWVRRYQVEGKVVPIRSKGRPKVMKSTARKKALELLTSGSSGGARSVSKILYSQKYTGKLVAASTVIRGAKSAAREAGDKLKCLRGPPRKGLLPKTKASRLRFALENKLRNWDRVMFTDRCKFHFKYPGTCVPRVRWFLDSKKADDAVFKPNNPLAYNVYGGITVHGTTRLIPVTGTSNMKTSYTNQQGQPSRNITKQEYEVVALQLLREGGRLFEKDVGEWVFQQDGDPTHSAAKAALHTYTRGGAGQSRVKILPNWPGNSPDLSPIENLWGYVNAEVAKKGCNTFTEFTREVDRVFHSIPKSMLRNCFRSIDDRLGRAIATGGGHTGY